MRQPLFLTCGMSGSWGNFCHILLMWAHSNILTIMEKDEYSLRIHSYVYTMLSQLQKNNSIVLHGEALTPISSLLLAAFLCEVVKCIYNLSSKKWTASHKINHDPSFLFPTRTQAAKLPNNLSGFIDLRENIFFFQIFATLKYFTIITLLIPPLL